MDTARGSYLLNVGTWACECENWAGMGRLALGPNMNVAIGPCLNVGFGTRPMRECGNGPVHECWH